MAVYHNPKIITNGLVLYLDAANRKSYPGSGTTWTDLSGNGNNGTLVGGVGYNSSKKGSLVFDGANDYISFVYTQPDYTTVNSFTWNIWVRPTQNLDSHVLMGNRGQDLNFTKLTTNRFEYYPLLINVAAPINIWQYISIVKNGTNFFYYRNSVLISSATSSETKPTRPFYVGGDLWANEFSNSNISQVSVYNRALTAQEIQQNFNATRSRFSI